MPNSRPNDDTLLRSIIAKCDAEPVNGAMVPVTPEEWAALQRAPGRMYELTAASVAAKTGAGWSLNGCPNCGEVYEDTDAMTVPCPRCGLTGKEQAAGVSDAE